MFKTLFMQQDMKFMEMTMSDWFVLFLLFWLFWGTPDNGDRIYNLLRNVNQCEVTQYDNKP